MHIYPAALEIRPGPFFSFPLSLAPSSPSFAFVLGVEKPIPGSTAHPHPGTRYGAGEGELQAVPAGCCFHESNSWVC